MPKGVLDGRHPVAIEFVFDGAEQFGASPESTIDRSVDVREVEHDADRRAADRARAEGTHRRMLVGQHDNRAADCELRMPYAAVWTAEPITLDRAECVLVKIDRLGRAVDDQVGRYAAVAVGDGFDSGHRKPSFGLLSAVAGCGESEAGFAGSWLAPGVHR